MRLLLVCLVLFLGGCGSPMLHLIECPFGSGDRETVCTPYLEILAEREGETYRFWGTMQDMGSDLPLAEGRIEVLETGQVVDVGPDGAFDVGGLEARHTLEFTASGTRPIRRRADRLYAEVRGR